jgi:hypothetical protein
MTMGTMARAHVAERFSVVRLVRDVDGLYRELLESSRVVLPPAARQEAEGVDGRIR